MSSNKDSCTISLEISSPLCSLELLLTRCSNYFFNLLTFLPYSSTFSFLLPFSLHTKLDILIGSFNPKNSSEGLPSPWQPCNPSKRSSPAQRCLPPLQARLAAGRESNVTPACRGGAGGHFTAGLEGSWGSGAAACLLPLLPPPQTPFLPSKSTHGPLQACAGTLGL